MSALHYATLVKPDYLNKTKYRHSMRQFAMLLCGLLLILLGSASWATGISGIYGHIPEIMALGIASDNKFYASTRIDGVFKNSDGGGTWTMLTDGLTKPNIRSLVADRNVSLYAGTNSGGLFQLGNAGNGEAINNSLADLTVTALIIDSIGTVYAGTASCGVFKLASGASTWTNIGLSDQPIFSFAIDNSGRLDSMPVPTAAYTS